MKKNHYDDPVFFDEYSKMNRSQKGLSGAGEWHQLKKMLPSFKDKNVLDLGCGYGWHCIYAIENNAKSVIGVDISEKMLTVAKEKNNHKDIQYIHSSIEDVSFKEESFDIVLSSLSFHYLQSFNDICRNVACWLKQDGIFIFSVEHPIFTAHGKQDWIYDEDGNILFFPVDRYSEEGKRNSIFLGQEVTKYHRTLTTYIKDLLDHGFEIIDFDEPKPDPSMLDLPGMKDELRRPMMLIIKAKKK